MYRVVIADDEPIIRKGLRETVEWDGLGLEISGEAANGIAALELIKANPPHILITDIKMPEMDGIELIREIKSLGLNIKIFILSGYSDYAFLKEAIKLGVESYLLKPIDNDELVSNLADAVNNIEKEIFEKIQQYQGSELMKSNVLNRLVTNGISAKEFAEKAAFLNIALEAQRYVCAVCAVENTTDGVVGGGFDGDEKLAVFAAHNICEELIHDAGISFIDSKARIVFLFSGGDEIHDAVKMVLSESGSRVCEYLGVSMAMGVGMSVSDIGDIGESYNAALKSLDFGIFEGSGRIIRYDDITRTESGLENISVNYSLIENLLKLGERDELFAYMDGIFGAIAAANISVDYVRSFVMRLAIETIGIFRETSEITAQTPSVSDFDYAGLIKFKCIKEFRGWYNRLCDETLSEAGILNGKSGGLASHVVSYIEEHYAECPTLKQVADIYNVNTSYLGQIFKKEIGISFTDYVNKCRIQKAKELLTDPRLKVYEIAEIVGFTDYHYFLKIFKKVTGANPTEIRGRVE